MTIDDSPSENTDAILKILDEYDQKATFFCVGNNIEKYPDNFRAIIHQGHSIGYHSYAHESSWKMCFDKLVTDHEKLEKMFSSKIYRPPYGKISLRFLYYLKTKNIKTILWTVLTEDWKELKDPIASMQKKLDKAPQGSIFVFHDNFKSFKNIAIMLPYFIQSARNKGISIQIIQ